MDPISLPLDLSALVPIGCAVVGTGVWAWALIIAHRIKPKATRKYGILYTCLKNTPSYDMAGKLPPESWLPDWYWYARAAWGCHMAKVYTRRSKGTPNEYNGMHPLVYVDSQSESVTCHCGGLSGQYVATRDATEVWFRASGQLESPPSAGRYLSDDEAARMARRQYEAEYQTAQTKAGISGSWIGPDESGGRRWKRDNEPKMGRFTSPEFRTDNLVRPSDWNPVDPINARCFCGHPMRSHETGGGEFRTRQGACSWREDRGAKCMCQAFSRSETPGNAERAGFVGIDTTGGIVLIEEPVLVGRAPLMFDEDV